MRDISGPSCKVRVFPNMKLDCWFLQFERDVTNPLKRLNSADILEQP